MVNNLNNLSNIIPIVFDDGNESEVILNYNSTDNITVSATFNDSTGLLNFSKNGSEILNRHQFPIHFTGRERECIGLHDMALTRKHHQSLP